MGRAIHLLPCRRCAEGDACGDFQRWHQEEAEFADDCNYLDRLDAMRLTAPRPQLTFAPTQPGWVGDHWGQVEVDPAKDYR